MKRILTLCLILCLCVGAWGFDRVTKNIVIPESGTWSVVFINFDGEFLESVTEGMLLDYVYNAPYSWIPTRPPIYQLRIKEIEQCEE